MFSQIFCASALVLSVLASPTPLPPCSFKTFNKPCACPSGTYYVNSTTQAVIGANAKAVAKITDNFLDTAWFGSAAASTTGHPHRVGSTRSFVQGGFTLTEELYSFKQKSCGSFTMKYIQHDAPITFDIPGAPQTYAGEWDTLKMTSISKDQTAVYWNIYSCFSVESPFIEFHESAINNVTAILKAEGKLTGQSEAPHSEETGKVPESQHVGAKRAFHMTH